MALFLSAGPSLDYWRSDAPYYAGELLNAPIDHVPFKNCEHTMAQIDRFPSFVSRDRNPVVEVLVARPEDYRSSKDILTRIVAFNPPARSFCKVRKGVYVCSPEFIFLLSASRLSLHALIALGCELCGTYSLFNDSPDGIKHAQITDVDSLGKYLDSASRVRGIKQAHRALRYVKDMSASPRETDLYMMFCLPSSLGGFGLKGAALNTPITVEGTARRLTGMDHITPDLFWEKGPLAVEYESTEQHGSYISLAELRKMNQEKLASDSERRRTYWALKIPVLTITNGEFIKYDEVERIARVIAGATNRHGLHSSLNTEFARSKLHEWLKVPADSRPDIM